MDLKTIHRVMTGLVRDYITDRFLDLKSQTPIQNYKRPANYRYKSWTLRIQESH